MPRLANHSTFSILVLALGAAACTGTPTPHPPDFLPSPQGSLINMETVGVASAEDGVPVSGAAGAVEGGTDVWIVNLDSEAIEPVRTKAAADGSFASVLVFGSIGDRVRLVSRTKEQHSPPLDLEIVTAGAEVGLRVLQDTSLDCLEVTPPDELWTVDEGSFVLTNGCDAALTITRAALRFADQGFALGTVGESLAVGATLRVPIRYDDSGSQDEQADILLLEVESEAERGRYALGLWGSD